MDCKVKPLAGAEWKRGSFSGDEDILLDKMVVS
jgi:hypothetical protein